MRCTLKSLSFHADREGVSVRGSAAAEGVVAKREDDGRYAFAEIECGLDVELDPLPQGDDLGELLDLAERDCFVGASLRPVSALRVARERRGRAMRILILGGTLFVGRHLVEKRPGARRTRSRSSTAGGRAPTSTPRWRRCTATAPRVTWRASAHGSWDVVVDTSARVPRWVRDAAGPARRPRRPLHVPVELLRLRGHDPSRHERVLAGARARGRDDRGDHERRGLRRAQGALRARARAGPPGALALRARRADRRALRHERALHVLGAPHRARGRRAGARAARPARAADPRQGSGGLAAGHGREARSRASSTRRDRSGR